MVKVLNRELSGASVRGTVSRRGWRVRWRRRAVGRRRRAVKEEVGKGREVVSKTLRRVEIAGNRECRLSTSQGRKQGIFGRQGLTCRLATSGCRQATLGCTLAMSGCTPATSGCRQATSGCTLATSGCRLAKSGCRPAMLGCTLAMSGCRLAKSGCKGRSGERERGG